MVGDAAVHILDPGETSVRATVFLQGLKKREAALVWGEERGPPRTRASPGCEQAGPGPLGWGPLAFVEAERQIIEGSAVLAPGLRT